MSITGKVRMKIGANSRCHLNLGGGLQKEHSPQVWLLVSPVNIKYT